MKKIGVALIGCGGFGRKVAKDVIAQSDRTEVRGLFDPSAKSIRLSRQQFGKNAGTHLLEKCCHDIDLANWMAGAKPSRVASFGGRNFFKPENKKYQRRLGKNTKGILAYGTFPGRKHKNAFTSDKDIVDNQVAILEYENGARATFHANMNGGIPERRMYILETEGAIRADVKLGSIEVCRIGFEEKVEL